MQELGIEVTQPVNVHKDNKTTIQIAATLVYHKITKHIEIDCCFIREKICKELVSTKYILTDEQPTDLLTKGLNKEQNHHFKFQARNIQSFFTS